MWVLLLAFGITSCTRIPTLDGFLPGSSSPHLWGEACPLHCYRGLTPGETTKDKAIRIIRSFAGSDQLVIYDQLLLWEEDQGVRGQILIEGGTVQSISLQFPPSTYPVNTLLETIGEPDSVHITLPHPRHSPDPDEPQCDVLRLVYAGHQAEVVLYQRRSGEVQPEHDVQRIILAPNRSPRAILTPFYERDWQGWGTYCIPVEDLFE